MIKIANIVAILIIPIIASIHGYAAAPDPASRARACVTHARALSRLTAEPWLAHARGSLVRVKHKGCAGGRPGLRKSVGYAERLRRTCGPWEPRAA